MKTKKELDDLKADWVSDPIYDLETTEGFEDHIDELLAFSNEQERKWTEKKDADIKKGQRWDHVGPRTQRLRIEGGFLYEVEPDLKIGDSSPSAVCFVPFGQ